MLFALGKNRLLHNRSHLQSHMAGAIYGFWKRKTVCLKIPNHVIEAVQKKEDRKQIEHAK